PYPEILRRANPIIGVVCLKCQETIQPAARPLSDRERYLTLGVELGIKRFHGAIVDSVGNPDNDVGQTTDAEDVFVASGNHFYRCDGEPHIGLAKFHKANRIEAVARRFIREPSAADIEN